MIHHVADRIAVMYLGKIVELAPAEQLYARPVHPYTEALLSAIPIADPDRNERRVRLILEGDVPSPLVASFGAAGSTRAARSRPRSARRTSRRWSSTLPGHLAACHHPRNTAPGAGPEIDLP